MREGNYLTCNKCSSSVRVFSSFQASLSRNQPVKIQCSSVKTCRGAVKFEISSILFKPFSLIALAGIQVKGHNQIGVVLSCGAVNCVVKGGSSPPGGRRRGLPYKNSGGDRRSFLGSKFVVWYPLGC